MKLLTEQQAAPKCQTRSLINKKLEIRLEEEHWQGNLSYGEGGQEMLAPWDTVEGSHEQVGDGEVEQEVVGDAPHGAVRQDDPQHHRVPHYCNHNDH